MDSTYTKHTEYVLSLVGFLIFTRPFRSSGTVTFFLFVPFVLTNGIQRSRAAPTVMIGWNGLSTVFERSISGLRTAYQRSKTVDIPFVPLIYRPNLNGSWTVYLRSGPKMGNRSVHRSVHHSVPLRSVPIQDRRVKNQPSLEWTGTGNVIELQQSSFS